MGFFIQWDKNSKPTDANSQSKSMDTSKQEWIRGYPLFASTHHKEDPQEEGMSDIQKSQAQCSTCTFFKHLRDSQS